MALSARLEIRQGQGLVITPQLQQAIKLLQLSNLELVAFVDAELERNPLLQRDERDAEPDAEAPIEAAADHSTDRIADADARAELDTSHDEASPGDRVTGDAQNDMGAAEAGASVDWSKAKGGGSFEGDSDGLESVLTHEKTLSEHLHDQLSACGLSGAQAAAATVLIDSVDEGGYLRADLAEIAERLGCAEELLEGVLGVLQGFEPAGICARDLQECLAIQLKDRNRYDPAMAALLDNLQLLAKRDMPALRRACGVDEEDLREMVAELRALTPRPGAAFGGEPAQTVVPDVYVREGLGGLWHVELNSETLPRLLVDQRYHARVSASARTDQEKTFVSDCAAQASWLVKSLDQRAKTILKVSSEIVRQQDAFLAYGVEHLRPLNLKTVADAIGMHEIDRQPGDFEQISGHPARRLRDEVLLHLGHPVLRGRRGALRRERAPQDQAADRDRGQRARRPLRRHHRRYSQGRRRRHRSPHRRQVPRSHAHPLVGGTPPPAEGNGVSERAASVAVPSPAPAQAPAQGDDDHGNEDDGHPGHWVAE